jgi:tetratricopeptide (TPR) repeat protein
MRCVAEVQKAMAESNASLPGDRRIEFRIGINVGDIVVEDGDIFGDGVNVAARLEGLADPGGICVSARVQEDAAGRLDLAFEDLGEPALKNIARPVRVYRVNRALATYFPITRERVFEALHLLERAIKIDPRYGPALAWAALCHSRRVLDGWADDLKASRRRATDLARQALNASENEPSVLAVAAFVLTMLGEDIDAMIGLVDRALALNPSFAHGWYISAGLRLAAGQADLALEHVETSIRLSPRESTGTPLMFIGLLAQMRV